MGLQPSKIANSLSEKYLALHEAFTELAAEATLFQNTLPITDKAQRGLFNSLSRIVAFSDQVHVALHLMGEDVQAIETTFGDPAATEWSDLDEHFDEWFANMSVANAKVH